MQYTLSSEFTKITETSGTMYVPEKSVEISAGSAVPAKGTGIVLDYGEKFPFAVVTSGNSFYARAVSSHAVLNVVPSKLPI